MRVKLQHYFLLLLFSLYICRCLYSYENYTHIFTCEYNCKHMHKNTVPSGAHTQLTKLPLCFHPSAYGVCPLPLIHPLWTACFIYISTSACVAVYVCENHKQDNKKIATKFAHEIYFALKLDSANNLFAELCPSCDSPHTSLRPLNRHHFTLQLFFVWRAEVFFLRAPTNVAQI